MKATLMHLTRDIDRQTRMDLVFPCPEEDTREAYVEIIRNTFNMDFYEPVAEFVRTDMATPTTFAEWVFVTTQNGGWSPSWSRSVRDGEVEGATLIKPVEHYGHKSMSPGDCIVFESEHGKVGVAFCMDIGWEWFTVDSDMNIIG